MCIFSYYIYDVTYGFVSFADRGCLECSCWGGSSAVCWSAIIVVRCGCFRDVSCVATSGVGRVVCCYLVFVSCNVLNIGLCVSMFVLFICRLSLLTLCILPNFDVLNVDNWYDGGYVNKKTTIQLKIPKVFTLIVLQNIQNFTLFNSK
jgi:hypothetical protein